MIKTIEASILLLFIYELSTHCLSLIIVYDNIFRNLELNKLLHIYITNCNIYVDYYQGCFLTSFLLYSKFFVIYTISYKNLTICIGGNSMKDHKLTIKKRNPLKGEDGSKVISIRIKDETVQRLDELVKETNRSRNEIIGILLEFGLDNVEVE